MTGPAAKSTPVFEDAARVRATESNCLYNNNLKLGALYLAGYVVECKLKALHVLLGRKFPASGRQGHDLRGLWNSAGLRFADISGERRAFLDTWDTSLRYCHDLPSGHDVDILIKGARDAAAYVDLRRRHRTFRR